MYIYIYIYVCMYTWTNKKATCEIQKKMIIVMLILIECGFRYQLIPGLDHHFKGRKQWRLRQSHVRYRCRGGWAQVGAANVSGG